MSAAQVRAYARKAQEFADANAVAKDLRRLLPLKTQAEYEPEGIAHGVAAKAVERAQRCTIIARAVVAGLN
ncbi:hypothetical protein [Candidatus Poriferisodalis sp.]|uniref:hypothetical protein n=1 Tax=Candidatus Poriferisodalis sp. TaxID=3101277 RepID=UPI003AF94C79